MLGEVGFETDGLGLVRNRLVVVALAPVGDTTVVVCLGIVGLEPDGLGETTNSQVKILFRVGIEPLAVAVVSTFPATHQR